MALPRYIPHYSLEDYVLWEGQWELWSGIPIAMTPSPGRVHQRVASNLHFALRTALTEGRCENCEVLFEIDWRVSNDTVLRPDLLIACGHRPSTYIEETPQLVAEILSDSSRQRDLIYKREMYQELGVLYYLIVDPREARWQLLQTRDGEFVACPDLNLELHPDCRINLDLESVFS